MTIPREIITAMPRDVREEWEERAAILEYEAGYSRDEAERIALAMIRQARACRDARQCMPAVGVRA